ncbi:MAG: carbohydrate kinase family protein, partial [bacterium]|nr:carbohydrate kinase family protein [bacterium]
MILVHTTKYTDGVFDLFAIGDITYDIFLTLNEARVRRVPHQHKAYLEIEYKDKVPVNTFATDVGGSATNTAVGVSRLGFHVGLYAVHGDDAAGMFVRKKLRAEHVDDRMVEEEKGGQTNTSVILVHESERTILPYYVPRTYKLSELPKARWMYLTTGGK